MEIFIVLAIIMILMLLIVIMQMYAKIQEDKKEKIELEAKNEGLEQRIESLKLLSEKENKTLEVKLRDTKENLDYYYNKYNELIKKSKIKVALDGEEIVQNNEEKKARKPRKKKGEN